MRLLRTTRRRVAAAVGLVRGSTLPSASTAGSDGKHTSACCSGMRTGDCRREFTASKRQPDEPVGEESTARSSHGSALTSAVDGATTTKSGLWTGERANGGEDRATNGSGAEAVGLDAATVLDATAFERARNNFITFLKQKTQTVG